MTDIGTRGRVDEVRWRGIVENFWKFDYYSDDEIYELSNLMSSLMFV